MNTNEQRSDGGPAFPISSLNEPKTGQEGLTIRDYFAMAFAQAMMGHEAGSVAIMHYAVTNGIEPGEACARIAYSHAQHMLDEREK